MNHYDGLRLFADRVELLAVVDYAEIPTLQQRPLLDADADGALSPAEAQRRAGAECAAVAGGVAVTGRRDRAVLDRAGRRAGPAPGEAGLSTTRVECRLSAPAALAGPATVEITDGYLADRIGWREITAAGEGVRLAASPVPAASVSEELRAYPGDLLTDPLDVRSATLRVEPGTGGGGQRPVAADRVGGRRPARRAERLVHRAGRPRRPDRRGRPARGAAGRGARRLARAAARARQDGDGRLPGRPARHPAGRAAGRRDGDRDAHRRGAGARAGADRVRRRWRRTGC